jgi:tetratricopeptide (TPR) repeat protein
MARSAQRRNRQVRERRPTPRATTPARPPVRTYEDTMFFPRLRRQAKWMFVFLAVIFGLGYVIFNVGGTIPGTGLGDVLQGLNDSTAGPSVGDSRDKVEDEPNNPTGYRDLATALQREGRNSEAIEPLETYLRMRPRDRTALSQLGGLYLAQARELQERGTAIQNQLTELTGGGLFTPSTSGEFGQEFGNPQITSQLSTTLTQELNQIFVQSQEAYKNATRAYQRLVAATPDAEEADQPSVFLQLAFAAQSGGDTKAAIRAYERFLKVAPDSPNARSVRLQLAQLKAAQKAQPPAHTGH